MLYILFIYLLKKLFDKLRAYYTKKRIEAIKNKSIMGREQVLTAYKTFYQNRLHKDRYRIIYVITPEFSIRSNIKGKKKKDKRQLRCTKILNPQIYLKHDYQLNFSEMSGLPFKRNDRKRYYKYIWKNYLKYRMRRLRNVRSYYMEWDYKNNPYTVVRRKKHIYRKTTPHLGTTYYIITQELLYYTRYVWDNFYKFLLGVGFGILICILIKYLCLSYLSNLTLFHILGYILMYFELLS